MRMATARELTRDTSVQSETDLTFSAASGETGCVTWRVTWMYSAPVSVPVPAERLAQLGPLSRMENPSAWRSCMGSLKVTTSPSAAAPSKRVTRSVPFRYWCSVTDTRETGASYSTEPSV